MPVEAKFSDIVRHAVTQTGFDVCGIAPLPQEYLPEFQRFEEWVAAGHAGDMEYMKTRTEQGMLKRASPQSTVPWAQSVIVCALDYDSAQPYSTEVAQHKRRGWISRYAWSTRDYHDVVLQKLRQVEAALREAARPHSGEIQTRCYVDTGPHLERLYAKYAGVGWAGKNTCIINQQRGSWLFLGIILTSLELRPDQPARDLCGSCTRCIEACPTDAIREPYQLDATRCISYLTIEKRGAIPEELRPGMGNHLFGCDICQDVCPWNRKPHAARMKAMDGSVGVESPFPPRPELVNPALDWIASMTREEFQKTFRNSPVKRAKYSGLRRNAAIAMGNSGDASFIPRLQEMENDSDAIVAEHAHWALGKLRSEI